MVELTLIETLHSILTISFITISIILGLKICFKYFKYKRIEFPLVGLTLMIMVVPYYSDVISFILLLTIGERVGVWFIFLGIAIVPIATITWLGAITELFFKERQKLILSFAIVQAVIFEIILFYAILYEPTLILIPYGEQYYQEAPILIAYYILALLIFIIAGFMFGIKSLRSSDKETRLQGKFIMIAMVSYVIGAFFDFAVEATILTVTLGRLIQISAYIEFYIGFMFPGFIQKLFIKEE